MLNEFLQTSSMWGVGLTLGAFALGTLVNRVTKKAVFNPLLLGSLAGIAAGTVVSLGTVLVMAWALGCVILSMRPPASWLARSCARARIAIPSKDIGILLCVYPQL